MSRGLLVCLGPHAAPQLTSKCAASAKASRSPVQPRSSRMPTSSGCMFRSPPSSTTSAAFEVCLWGQGWLSFPALPATRLERLGPAQCSSSLFLTGIGAKWSSLGQAPGAGVTTHVLGTCRGTPCSCSPDELCQLPGLHQAVGQVGVFVPAVLGVQLGREGKQRGCDSCPAPRLPANPPNPSKQSLPTPLSLCHPHGGEPGMPPLCTARLWVPPCCPER